MEEMKSPFLGSHLLHLDLRIGKRSSDLTTVAVVKLGTPRGVMRLLSETL